MSEGFERIVEAIGPAAAKALTRAFGGRRVYIPAFLPADHPLARAIGFENALLLRRLLGAGALAVPSGVKENQQETGQRILALTRDGHSAAEIAAALGVTERTVFNWRARAARPAKSC
jgi:DNA-binding NarL/FixJ family response regulator